MATRDSFARHSLEEPRRRTNRHNLVVYEGTNAEATVYPTEPELFTDRHRSATIRECRNDAPWTTTVTLKDTRN